MGFDNPPRPWAELEKLLSWRGTETGEESGAASAGLGEADATTVSIRWAQRPADVAKS